MELCRLCGNWIDPEMPHTDCDEILAQDEGEFCDCGHKISDHAGTFCMNCKCGTEEYDHEFDEPLNTTPSWKTGLRGQEGYES